MASLWVVCGIPIIAQKNDDGPPPIKGKYWLHRHLVDKEELAFIRQVQALPEKEYEIVKADKGVADELLGVNTNKVEGPHVFLESDSMSVEELTWVAKYQEAVHHIMSDFHGYEENSLPLGGKFRSIFLTESAYPDFVRRALNNQREIDANLKMDDFFFKSNGVNSYCSKLEWKSRHADEAVVYAVTLIPYFLTRRLPVFMGGVLCDYFGFYSEPVGVKIDETSRMTRIPGMPFPDWVNAVYRHYFPIKAPRVTIENPDGTTTTVEPKEEAPKEIHKLKYIIEGPFDGLDATGAVKLWAFSDWLLLAQREKLKTFLKSLREKSAALAKELKVEHLSSEQTKRLMIECLESAFGKNMDVIEEDFKAYVIERYFPADEAQKIKQLNLFRLTEYKPK